jgi:acyl carrier protein
LTAERFVPDPYSTAGGARLYRTGDVCRYHGDGELEYGWRVDEQVKVHGQRLELGEVEAALSAQPEVRASVVRVVADAHGEQRIIAYVVLRSGVEVAAQELRRRVGERLPAYMIPAIVFLKEFPLTASFKIDFRALPLPERCDYQAENYYVAPRSAIEEMLAGIWREMLRVDRVGIYDNFFELGGHSLLAIRLITQVRKAFGIELPVRVVFEAPTVEMFAKKIEETSVTAQPPTKTIRVIPRGDRNLEQLLKELEGLSTEEVRSALASQRQKPSGARARDDSDFANPAR